MLRGFYIGITVLWLIFEIFIVAWADETRSARWSSYDSYSYGGYDNYDYDYGKSYTTTGATVSLFMFLIYVTVGILTLAKLKSKTMKVLSIIGLSLTGIMLFFDAVMFLNPGSASFDEVGIAFLFYTPVMLGFSIVGIIHAFKFEGKAAPIVDEPERGERF